MLESNSEEDINVFELLDFLSNTTRRKILELLSAEDLYPFQISRILKISPRLIKEYLTELENLGLISMEKRDSDKGPQRIYASLNNAFSLIIDVAQNTFDVKYVRAEKTIREKQKTVLKKEKVIKQISKNIAEIRDNLRDKLSEIRELDETRKQHVEEINKVFSLFNDIIANVVNNYDDRVIVRNMFKILITKPDNRVSLTELSGRLRMWRGDLSNRIDRLTEETNLIKSEEDRRGEIWYSI
ncbi:MAG: ArsR family transcriptional regulator [Candidatus Heimdallarchaeota archaeon]